MYYRNKRFFFGLVIAIEQKKNTFKCLNLNHELFEYRYEFLNKDFDLYFTSKI